MPLSPSSPRREIHHRVIDMKAYAREDGLYDIEAHLVDRKRYESVQFSSGDSRPAGQPIHDLSVRVTVDDDYVVRAIEAASDVTPYPLCKEAESTLQVIVGERIASGWSSKVKQHLRGAASCTHLMEMLIPLGTTAYQGIRSLQRAVNGKVGARAEVRVDSCYSYGAHRAVIREFWPQHYRPLQPTAKE